MPGLNGIDDLIRRLGGSTAWDALSSVSRQKSPASWHARQLLGAPRAADSMQSVDELLADHRLAMGPLLGRGAESLVFNAVGEGPGMVIKLQPPDATGFRLPQGIAGVAGYVAQDRLPSGMRVAIQPRASSVKSFGGIAEESKWAQMAHDVQKSLASRGYDWSDPHSGNVGIMPDGNMAAIDGALLPMNAGDVIPDNVRMSVEDAIRLLRPPARYQNP